VDGATDFLAMENLRMDGYKMGNRITGLDFNHCVLVVRQLARYHALSYVKFGGSRQRILECLPVLRNGMFSAENKTAEMQQQFFCHSFKSQAKTLGEMGETLASSRLEKLSNMNLFAELGDLVETDMEAAVVIHGDSWVNNMLFKYEDHDLKCRFPVGIKFLDFQLATASSRLVDFYYFLLTSAKMDVLKFEEDLLAIYYSEFTSYANMLGVDTQEKGLTWSALLKESDRYRFYGVCLGLLLAPMLAAESSQIPDMDQYTAEDLENTEETMKQFYDDISKGSTMTKAKILVLEHLPRCVGVDKFL